MSQVPAILGAKEDDIRKLLACNVHLGSKNCDPTMLRYVYKRRQDGHHIIDLSKTWEKIVLAARIIVAIENPADVAVISARPFGGRAVLKFAQFTGSQAISGRFTPGTFTNQIQEKFMEPRLLIITDPFFDSQPIRESAYVNIPTIAFCQTDTNARHIDVVIPSNNKGKEAIGLLYWLLAREVLYLRKTLNRAQPWSVMVDLFFYRDPDAKEAEEAAAEESARNYDHPHVALEPQGAPDWAAEGETTWAGGADNWASTGTSSESWGDSSVDVAPVAPPADAWENSLIPATSWDTPAVEQ
jgi:small subunit ribosomal protein SAe